MAITAYRFRRRSLSDVAGMAELQNRLQQIFEDQLDATCVICADLKIILANPAFALRFNQPADGLIGMDYRKLLPDQVRDQILTALAALTPDTPTCVLQLEMSQEAGRIRVTEFHGRAVFDECGSLVEYHTFGRQLTERIVVQRELERKNRFLDIIMEFLPVSLAIREAKTRRFVLVNRAVGTDKSAADYIGKTFFELMPEKKASELTALDDQAVGDLSKTTLDEFFVDKPDGRHLIHQRLRAVPGSDGEAEFILTLIEDVTDRWKILEDLRASEASLKRSQSMAKIGSWRFSLDAGQIEWSDQMYYLWGQEPGAFRPTRASILAQICEKDKPTFSAKSAQDCLLGNKLA